MFTSEQVKQAFGTAQAKAAAKAKEFEAEARKVLEALGDRAQAELKVLISRSRSSPVRRCRPRMPRPPSPGRTARSRL